MESKDLRPAPLSALIDAAREDSAILRFNMGIERETLRVTPEGSLALTPHPAFLGSKLTHPRITTDFSESQLELITPVHHSASAALEDLASVHRFIYSGLASEILWSASMPCVLQDDEAIPLAYYGESNLGRLKTTYRNGLGYRYGRGMQTICAVHYNFSLSDAFWAWLHNAEHADESPQAFRTRRYFDLMRNFRRHSWLLTYLFGASPAVCNSFLRGKSHVLQPLDEGTAYLPYATSLRSGNLGYQSDAQSANMRICFNDIDSYVSTLASAISERYPPYEAIGLRQDGEYRQVNASILQSEAEFYSSIRAKRVPPPGTNFLASLRSEGVEYIEVRLLDVNPYLPLGVDEHEIRFLNAFLLFCLLSDSPAHDDPLCDEVAENSSLAVSEGRNPTLMLKDQGQLRPLRGWASDVLSQISAFAAALDEGSSPGHIASLQEQQARVEDASLTPSGMILADLTAAQIPFFRFAMNKALSHRAYFQSQPPDAGELAAFEALTRQSVEKQLQLEAADRESFDDYLARLAAEYLPLR